MWMLLFCSNLLTKFSAWSLAALVLELRLKHWDLCRHHGGWPRAPTQAPALFPGRAPPVAAVSATDAAITTAESRPWPQCISSAHIRAPWSHQTSLTKHSSKIKLLRISKTFKHFRTSKNASAEHSLPSTGSHTHEASLAQRFLLWRFFTDYHYTKGVIPLFLYRSPTGVGAHSASVHVELPPSFRLLLHAL